MPGDPKECRQHAANCMQLAGSATSPNLRRSFIELANHWNNIAAELDDAQSLINTLNQLDLSGPTRPDHSVPADDAGPRQVNKWSAGASASVGAPILRSGDKAQKQRASRLI
jgi:hypothetical protein